jgi:cyclophilin family peptidyl-prolyl cis-trans isomerase
MIPVKPAQHRDELTGRKWLLTMVGCLALLAGVACEASQENDMSQDPAIQAIDQFIERAGVDTSARGWKTGLKAPEMARFDKDVSYFWNLETNVGELKVKLRPDVAPMHVTSTIYLTRLGFYDGTSFHRVITDFMAQGGDPLGNGTGGPGYEYGGEFDASLRHDRPGLLSMANRGPGTDGSQFFLTFVATPWLDDKHSIFGEVIGGEGTLKALEARGSQSGRTSEPLEIRKATITIE